MNISLKWPSWGRVGGGGGVLDRGTEEGENSVMRCEAKDCFLLMEYPEQYPKQATES